MISLYCFSTCPFYESITQFFTFTFSLLSPSIQFRCESPCCYHPLTPFF